MNFLKEIQITNDLQIVKLFNDKYCDKIKDLKHPTRISLLNNNKRLDNAILNTYELRQENRLYRARNQDLELLNSRLQLHILQLERDFKKMKDDISKTDTFFNDFGI
jgi:hypothetical protein